MLFFASYPLRTLLHGVDNRSDSLRFRLRGPPKVSKLRRRFLQLQANAPTAFDVQWVLPDRGLQGLIILTISSKRQTLTLNIIEFITTDTLGSFLSSSFDLADEYSSRTGSGVSWIQVSEVTQTALTLHCR